MNALSFFHRLALAVCLAATFTMNAAASTSAVTPTVHLISIGDSLDESIGRKVGEDARNIVSEFESCFSQAGRSHMLRTRLMLGEEVSSRNILDAIRSLAVQPQDTIVFMFSGHGYTDSVRGNMLTMAGGRDCLARSELLSVLRAKNVRLAVVLTDACSGYGQNSGLTPTPVVPTYTPRPLTCGPRIDFRTMTHLFLSHRGLVDLAAAEPGYNAQTDQHRPGSLFLNAFLITLKAPHQGLIQGLDRDSDGNLQWDELLPQVRGLAAHFNHQQAVQSTGVAPARPQQAYATVLGEWAPGFLIADR